MSLGWEVLGSKKKWSQKSNKFSETYSSFASWGYLGQKGLLEMYSDFWDLYLIQDSWNLQFSIYLPNLKKQPVIHLSYSFSDLI